MKKFVYLVQGESNRVKDFYFLSERNHSEALFLTYDSPLDGAIFLPNSTWGEGRNLLLKKALKVGKNFDYFIFLDDDVSFKQGSFELFEKLLFENSPAIAVPVFFPKTIHTVLAVGTSLGRKFYYPIVNQQICKYADAQFMAFHKDVIATNIVFPLQTHFDKHSWGATSSTQQLLIHNLYESYFLQFNKVIVENMAHRSYTDNEFANQQRSWFNAQFKKTISDPRPHALNYMSLQGLRYFVRNFKKLQPLKTFHCFLSTIHGSLFYKKKNNYKISATEVLDIFKQDSELLSQYNNNDS